MEDSMLLFSPVPETPNNVPEDMDWPEEEPVRFTVSDTEEDLEPFAQVESPIIGGTEILEDDAPVLDEEGLRLSNIPTAEALEEQAFDHRFLLRDWDGKEELAIGRDSVAQPRREARRWCCTYFGNIKWWEHFEVWKQIDYIRVNRECSALGNVHYQMWFQTLTPRRVSWLRHNFNGQAHYEPMKGTTAQNEHYCTKPVPGCDKDGCSCKEEKARHDAFDVPWVPYNFTFGEPPQEDDCQADKAIRNTFVYADDILEGRINREELVRRKCYITNKRAYDELLEEKGYEKTKVCTVILHGASGTGKSWFIRNFLADCPLGEPANVWQAPAGNREDFPLNGYRGQLTCAWNDDDLLLKRPQLFKRICDPICNQVDIKGKSAKFPAILFVIATNLTPEEWWGGQYVLTDGNVETTALKRRVHFDFHCDMPYTYENHRANWDLYYKPRYEILAKKIKERLGF